MNKKILSYFGPVPYYVSNSGEMIFIKRKLFKKYKAIIYSFDNVNNTFTELLHYKKEPFIDGVMFELGH